MATRVLADFGAEVIKIEDRNHLDRSRRLPIYKEKAWAYGEEDPEIDANQSGVFNNYNRNKYSMTLDMATEAGREIAKKLIAESSVLTENFSPGVMERWGLDEAAVRELRPDIIYARMSGFGHSGPYAHYHSYGPTIQAVGGIYRMSGLPGREPSGFGLSYLDNQAAYYDANAILAAIYARNETGQGTDVDMAAIEIAAQLIGPKLLDISVNGRSTGGQDFPNGNQLEYPRVAPHGVYPCRGEDRWVAIAVFSDSEWDALAAAVEQPTWTDDPRFSSMELRCANQEFLDKHLAEWTSLRDRHEVMATLQGAGVRASAVQDQQDVNEHDPQMAHRAIFFEMSHPIIGDARFEGHPFLGEDSAYVLRSVLEMSEEEIVRLAADKVI
jgi:crotonobetainyl-CoA:carnitine CoA-transferase CaiB-like acyl-CoA transferase